MAFLVSYGKVGREFIDKMTEHINDWNNGSKMQPIALNAALYFLQSAYKSLARSQRLRITKSFWLSDWYCGMRVKSTNCCAKDG